MPLFNRSDGVPVTGESPTHLLMPHLMPRRAEAQVFLEQKFDVTNLLAYLDRARATRPAGHLTLFVVLLCAMARAHSQRPKMNRFVIGGRIYQRHKLEYSFGVKKRLDDAADLTVVKMAFEPDDTLDTVAARLDETISRGRGDQKTESEREMGLLSHLPAPLIRLAVSCLRLLDRFNLMPQKMIDADELYCSMFIANLGSVGLEAPFHHLYEWGTAPIFCSIGKIEPALVPTEGGRWEARPQLTIRWSFDERIADGFYCARTLDLVREHLQHPERLERRPGEAAPAEPTREAHTVH